jgi:hypothetical protein
MLRGESARIMIEERPTEVGFFTTRAVDADSADEAVAAALERVRRDLRYGTVGDAAAVALEVEEVSVESWWWRRLRQPAGFIFFLAEPDGQELGSSSDRVE